MKRFILYILLFFALIAVVDWGAGKGFDYCLNHLKGGQYHSLQYAMKETKADVLVFGSSRAINHYVPKVIEDSLGLTCYNCGFHAQGIIFQYGRLRYILNRYKPKMVIYDVEYNFDLAKGENERYLDMLKPYCSDTCIANYFKEYSLKEYLKNLSHLYRYNSNFINLSKDYLTHGTLSENGYEPLRKTMDYDVTMKEILPIEVDSIKFSYLRKMILACKANHIPLIMLISPRYDAISSVVHQPIKDLCKEYGVLCKDYFTDSCFQSHKEYFANTTHLNEKGAIVYTSRVLIVIKNQRD